MASGFLILASFYVLGLVSAEPSIYFPFNSQLPPVARISEAFSYALSPQTFFSESNLTYSLQDAPKWLSIDDQTGRLSGTPKDEDVPEGDIVGIPVDIVASDDSGSATMTATLVVSRARAPTIARPLLEQIADFGDQSAPDAIISYPSSPFSFTFAEDTFSSDGPLSYYASSADSSPLPSWVTFDAESMTFSGQTPPFENLVQPPQSFDFQLVASDVEGFSAASMPFSIVVGSRKLTMDDPLVRINATRGKRISYRELNEQIQLDGETVNPSELTVATENMPRWLSVDESTLEIRGTPPNDAQSSNATIVLQNSLSDSLRIQVAVNIATEIFRRTFSDMRARSEEPFKLDLEPYLWEPKDVTLEVDAEPSQDWLELDGLVISGTPPESAEGDENINIRVAIKATVKSSGESETENVRLRVLSATETASSTTTTSTSEPTEPTESTSTPTPSESSSSESDAAAPEPGLRSGMSAGQIMLAVLVPILVIAALILLLICMRKRRERKFRKILAEDISGPIPGTFIQNGSLHSESPSAAEVAKAYHNVPPPPAAYRPGGRINYFRAALRRLRSNGSVSTLDSDSRHSIEVDPPVLPRLRSTRVHTVPGSRYSWITEEGEEATRFHRVSQRRSRLSLLSLYESIREITPKPRFLRTQTDDSFRSTLDVTIPSIDHDGISLEPTTTGTAQAPDKDVPAWAPEMPRAAITAPLPSPAAASSDALASIPEQASPLGSHPIYGKKFPSVGRSSRFRVYSDQDAASQPSLMGARESEVGLDLLARQGSLGSDLSRGRPVSRRSDASPWFGGRTATAVPPRNPRRFQFEPDMTSSVATMSASPSMTSSVDTGTVGNENWQTHPRGSTARGNENWQTIARDSSGAGYDDLVRESPFYPSRASRASHFFRPVRSRKENSQISTGNNENKRFSTWAGKTAAPPEDQDQSWPRDGASSLSLMSPSKWETAGNRAPLAERPISSIRYVQPSGNWATGRDAQNSASSAGGNSGLGMGKRGTYYPPRDPKLARAGSEESDWVTEAGTTLGREDSSARGKRKSTFFAGKEDSQREGISRDGSAGDYAVFI